MLTEDCQYAHLSVIRAVSPPGDIYYRLQESSSTGEDVARRVRDLLSLTTPKRLIIGDGASKHRSQKVKDFLHPENPEGQVPLARLPAHGPQVNVAEPVWAWFTGEELKKVGGKTLEELTKTVQKNFEKLTAKLELIQKILAHPEVDFHYSRLYKAGGK